jgi:uncharacterized protein YbjT (DUF2867 family)
VKGVGITIVPAPMLNDKNHASMNLLLTGATGYIGRRLLPLLLESGHHVVCLVRDKRRFDTHTFSEDNLKSITLLEGDLTDSDALKLPRDLDAAYYLVHSMSSSNSSFKDMEAASAKNFITAIEQTNAKQIIFLSGITNDDDLSEHLSSRRNVEEILRKSSRPVTILRAAIIIGSGSASFEIIRDLVEKLPVMIAPRWLKTKCQPIAIRNVLEYLKGVLLNKEALNKTFDIGGTDILSYKDMLYGYASVRRLKRSIITVPVLSPRLSSMWLVFVTSTTYALARNLVSSMKNEVICKDNAIQSVVPTKILSYNEALRLAFDKIDQNEIVSSWKDAISMSALKKDFLNNVQVPDFGVYTDEQSIEFDRDKNEVIDNLWSIGGRRGWYFANWMWRMRGTLDKLAGGVGLRRGRRSEKDLKAGDALDFWRVLLADKKGGRLLLYAEMKLPGEAWLEFLVSEKGDKNVLVQTATFRPLGLWGRIYWFAVFPFHGLIFPRMARRIVAHRHAVSG